MFASCCWKKIRLYNTIFSQFQKAIYEKKILIPPTTLQSPHHQQPPRRPPRADAGRPTHSEIYNYMGYKKDLYRRERGVRRGLATAQKLQPSRTGVYFWLGGRTDTLWQTCIRYTVTHTHTRRCILMFIIILYPTIGCGMVNITQWLVRAQRRRYSVRPSVCQYYNTL